MDIPTSLDGITSDELFQEWMQELRSGKHQKCSLFLKDENGAHCAIGVLGEILVKRDNRFFWDDGRVYFKGENDLELPSLVLLSFAGNHNMGMIWTWNDNKEMNLSFPEIANRIEGAYANTQGEE